MLPKFPYMAMSVTGVIHIILGLMIFIMTCVGFNRSEEISKMIYLIGFYKHSSNYNWNDGDIALNHELSDAYAAMVFFGSVIPSSIMIVAVGILGVLTGVKRKEHKTTQRLKLAYMILSILSAILACPAGVGVSVISVIINFSVPGILITLSSFTDFIVSIVSASYCCCSSETTSVQPNHQTGIVYDQTPTGSHIPGSFPPWFVHSGNSHPYANGPFVAYPSLPHTPLPAAVQNVSAPPQEPSSESDNQQTQQKNETGGIMPVPAPPGYLPPGHYPTGTHPPGINPPASYPFNIPYVNAQSPEGGIDNPTYEQNIIQSTVSTA